MNGLEQRPGRGLWYAALAVGLLPFLALALRFNFVCDDAFISFRYARNLARGAGLIFNPGADPPVEGYSEFLWVVLLAIPELLGWMPDVFARVLSVGCGVALFWTLARHLCARSLAAAAPGPSQAHGRLAHQRLALLGALLFVATLPPLGVWATGGMATMPFAWAVFLTYDALFRDPEQPRTKSAALYAILAALLRADGAWWVAAILGMGIGAGYWTGRKTLGRSAFLAAVLSLAVFALHVAWRYVTYGDYVPNTARAKLGFGPRAFERGGRYVALYVLTLPSIPIAFALGLASWKRARHQGLLFAVVPILATWLYAWLVGGDFMAFGRFLVPSLPFVGLLLAPALAWIAERFHPIAAGALSLGLAAVSLLTAFDQHVVPLGAREKFRFRWNSRVFVSEYDQWRRMAAQADEWRTLGLALRDNTRPGESLVIPAVGCVGYFSELFLYDRNGLVTRSVALKPASTGRKSPGHDKTVDPEFFNDESPTYLDAFLFPLRRKLPPQLKARGLHGPLPTDANHDTEGPLALYVQLGE